MAEKGMSDEEIQKMGRWSSRAFEHYIKLPRTKQALTALRLGKLKATERLIGVVTLAYIRWVYYFCGTISTL